MGKPAKNRESQRLNLDMPVDLMEMIENLRGDSDTMSSVVRKAIKFYNFLAEQKKAGGKLFIHDEKGEREILFID